MLFYFPRQFRPFVPAILILLVFIPNVAMGQETEESSITIDSTLVILNAAITDANGRLVSGLKKNEFTILEDGIEQTVDFFSAEETPFAAVILIDTSGSMGRSVSLARAAATRFLDGLRPDDNVAIYSFDTKVTLVQDFSNSRDVSERIFDLKSYGWTVMNDAVFTAAEALANRPEKRRAIILLSDGADTRSSRSASRALQTALAADAAIYTVDMAPSGSSSAVQNRSVLRNFSQRTGGTFISTPGGIAMREAFEKIVAELGVQYTLGYSPKNTVKDGTWRAIEVRVARPRLTIRTRQGYTAERAARN
ncbi:MAG TPA: VWA domain-containing protein [Pyrinomonadaceae bacterium]|nr:VWA domain-containing protein [Pyrinomonadaceae bacterium]HMP65017.1 VWA domain-containing protein [Pyrinomonadaceae bacterium]